jgi:hypothetical protein
MGRTGIDVATEAAAMILTNDNFAAIITAIQERRALYDNIIKFARLQLSTTIGAVMTVFGAPLLGLPDPLTPIQILWVAIHRRAARGRLGDKFTVPWAYAGAAAPVECKDPVAMAPWQTRFVRHHNGSGDSRGYVVRTPARPARLLRFDDGFHELRVILGIRRVQCAR